MLDEDYELELEDATLSREIAKIYRSSHPDALDRRVYLTELVRLQSELIQTSGLGTVSQGKGRRDLPKGATRPAKAA